MGRAQRQSSGTCHRHKPLARVVMLSTAGQPVRRDLNPCHVEPLHGEGAKIVTLPIAAEFKLVAGEQAQRPVGKPPVAARHRQQLQLMLLSVAPQALPGQLGLTSLVPKRTGQTDQQHDPEHFFHGRAP